MPDEKYEGYYIVNRNPDEIRHMIEWAKFHAENVRENKLHQAAVRGILLAFSYLTAPEAPRPDEYKGLFTLENILKDSKEPNILKEYCSVCVHKMRDEKIARLFRNTNQRIVSQDTESPDQ